MTGKNRVLKQKVSSIIKTLCKANPSLKTKPDDKFDTILTLVSAVLWPDGDVSKAEFKCVISALKKEIPGLDEDKIASQLKQKPSQAKRTKAASDLSHLNLEVKEKILQYLMELAGVNDKYAKQEQEIIDSIRVEFSISDAHAYELWKKATKKPTNKIIGSGTALAIVFVIIIVFILAASFFLSVIFGLILAYFFLPIQSWFKNRIFSSKFAAWTSRFMSIILLPITYPLKKLSYFLPKTKRLDSEPVITSKEQKEIKLINVSCRTTVLLVMILLCGFIFTAGLFSTTYFAYATNSLSHWAKQTTETYETHLQIEKNGVAITKEAPVKLEKHPGTKPQRFLRALVFRIESVKPKLDKIPLFKEIREHIAKFLKDPQNIKKASIMILKKSGGLFSYTAGIIGTIVLLIMNIVLSLFFFAFFLSHMARFNDSIEEKATAGEHIVNGILNSGWLPDTTRDTKYGAIAILNNIFARLRSWIRGYLTIIIIENRLLCNHVPLNWCSVWRTPRGSCRFNYPTALYRPCNKHSANNHSMSDRWFRRYGSNSNGNYPLHT